MRFEFDAAKSESNRRKHGIDFVEAQQLWNDDRRVEVPARTEDEPRFLVVGRSAERHWSAIVIYRDGAVRFISVRRARSTEVEIYESEGL